jgi:hypothetical protein
MARYTTRAYVYVFLGALLQSCSSSVARDNQEWLPDRTLVQALEGRITMPEGAGPMVDYARFYSAEQRGTHRIVVGIFVINYPADTTGTNAVPPGAYIVTRRELPAVLDGGCRVVTIQYDVELDSIRSVSCNGVG